MKELQRERQREGTYKGLTELLLGDLTLLGTGFCGLSLLLLLFLVLEPKRLFPSLVLAKLIESHELDLLDVLLAELLNLLGVVSSKLREPGLGLLGVLGSLPAADEGVWLKESVVLLVVVVVGVLC